MHQLPGTPWSVRTARGTAGRPAMEVYAGQTLLDVVVATPLTAEILRGARRTYWNDQSHAVAWGRLPADGSPIEVRFSLGRAARRETPGAQRGQVADVTVIEEWFWLAMAQGRFDTVTVTRDELRRQRRIAAVDPA
jgi:hypothetical protein